MWCNVVVVVGVEREEEEPEGSFDSITANGKCIISLYTTSMVLFFLVSDTVDPMIETSVEDDSTKATTNPDK